MFIRFVLALMALLVLVLAGLHISRHAPEFERSGLRSTVTVSAACA